jgi:RHS repeat-associated protein
MLESLFGRGKSSKPKSVKPKSVKPKSVKPKSLVKPAFEPLERRELMNAAPVITGPSTPYSYEGASGGLLQIVATDADGDPLTYVATGLPPGLSIDGSGMVTGTIHYSAASYGSTTNYSPTVTVFDGLTSTTANFNWVVSDVPLFGWSSYWYGNEGQSVSLSLAPTSGPAAAYTSSNLPSWLTLNSATGVLSGWMQHVPNNPSDGGSWMTPTTTLSVSVTASVTGAGSETLIVPLSVTDSNRLPSGSWRVYSEGAPVSWSMAANNALGNVLTYSASGLPLGVTIDAATGLIGGSADYTAASAGTTVQYTATVTVTDQWGAIDKQTQWLAVSDVPLVQNQYLGVYEGSSLSIYAGPSSPPSGIAYSTGALPAGLTLNTGTGLITGRPQHQINNPSPGGWTASTATVTATYGAITDVGTIVWTVSDVNRLPSPTSTYAYSEGQSVSIPFAATDLTGSSLTYTASGLPSGLSINSGTGLITGTVNFNAVSYGTGYPTATVTLTDNRGGTDYRSVNWAISDVPLFGWSSYWYGNEGQSVSLSLAPTSGPAAAYTSSNLPSWLTLNSATGVLSGWMQHVPNNPSDGGSYMTPTTTLSVSVTATVTGAGSETLIVPLSVTDSNRLPSGSWRSVYEGDPISWSMAANNALGNSLTYSASGLPAGVGIDAATGLIEGRADYTAASAGSTASFAATVSVWDQWGALDKQTVWLTVSDTPSVAFASATWSAAENSGSKTVTAYLGTSTDRTVTVQYATSDGKAKAGLDYTATAGTLTFAPYQTSQTFVVPILDDTWAEGNESLGLTLFNPIHAVLGSGSVSSLIIVDDDHPPTAVDDPSGSAPRGVWWPFDENAGSTAKDVRLGREATLPSGVAWTTDVPSATGSGSSLQFASASGAVTTDPFDLGAGDFAAAAWVKWNTLGTASLLGQSGSNGSFWSLKYDQSLGKLIFQAQSSTQAEPTTLQYAWTPASGWHHLAVTRSGATWTLYVDGASAATASGSDPLDVGETAVAIGSASLAAQLDDVRLLRGALSGSEVSSLAAGSYAPSVTAYAVTEDVAFTLAASAVLANDSDPDGDPLSVIGWGQPKHGSLVYSGSSFTYTPEANYWGPDAFLYTISDGKGGTASAYVYLDVASANDDPVAQNDADVTDKNTPVTIDVLVNDADPDGEALTLTSVGSPSHGTASIVSGKVVYTPTTNYVGADSFTYEIEDPHGDTATATVNVFVSNGQWATSVIGTPNSWDYAPYDWLGVQALGAPNTFKYGDIVTAWAPKAIDFDPDFGYYVTFTVGFATADHATGLLVRETYGNGFVAQIDLQEAGGTWHNAQWIASDLDYDASAPGAPVNFWRTWSQTSYEVKAARITIALGSEKNEWEEIDAIRLLNATATSTVTTAPTASSASFSVDEDGSQVFDVQGRISNSAGYPLVLAISSAPSHGYAEIDFNGTPEDSSDDKIVYTPDPDYFGSDSFQYAVTDIWGQTSTATATITVNSVNDAPTLDQETIFGSAVKNTALTVDLGDYASDVEGDSLTASATGASHGTLSVSGSTVVYTPASGWTGIDAFSFTLSDGHGGSVSGKAVVTTYETGQWASGVVSFSSQYDTADWSASQALGAPDVFWYGDDAKAWAPANEDDNGPTDEETLTTSFATPSQATGVVVRESSGTGFVKKIELQDTDNLWHTMWTGTDAASAGYVADFVLTFPQTAFTAKAARITIGIGGADKWEEIDAVRLLTGGVYGSVGTSFNVFSAAPALAADWAAGDQDAVLNVRVLSNDVDPEGDAISLVAVTQGAHGSVSINANGTPSDPTDDYLAYTPSLGFAGTDSFTYTAADPFGNTVTATVSVRIGNGQWASSASASSELGAGGSGDYRASQAKGAPNTPSYGQSPTAWAPAKAESGTQTLTVQFASADYASGLLVRETANNGFVVRIDLLDSSNVWHNSVWTGTDSTPADQAADFVATWTTTGYLVKGARIHVDTDLAAGYEQIDAVRLLTTNAATPPSAPSLTGDSVSTQEDRPVAIAVLANDSLGAATNFTLASAPSHGQVQFDGSGTPDDVSDDRLVYTPDADWNGTDSFTYRIEDAYGRSALATVTVSVSAVNDAPLAYSDSALTTTGSSTTIDVLANDADPESQTLTLTSVAAPAHGTASISGGMIVYTPSSGYSGPDAFWYAVSDGSGGTARARVDVLVQETGQWASAVLGASSGVDSTGDALGAPSIAAPTVWSPTQASGLQFLHVQFATAADATGVLIRQTQGAGTLRKVELIEADGTAHAIWSGTDPSTASGTSDFLLRFPETAYQVKSVRLFVDSTGLATDVEAVRLLTGGTFSALKLSRREQSADGTSTETVYGSDGLVAEQSIYQGGSLSQVVANTYSSGHLSTQDTTDALGRTTRKTFDAAGHVLTQTAAYGTADAATTTFGYADGKRTSLVDPVGNETLWTYDGYGRESTMTDPKGGVVTKTYDSAGRLASILNRNDLLRTFDYDSAGRLVEEVWYDGPTTGDSVAQTLTWDYDADGLLSQASKTDGTHVFTYSYRYDSQGRVIHVDEPFGVSLDFGYDDAGRRNYVKDSLGGEERSVYDDLGQLVSRTLKQGSTSLRNDFTYTANGQVETQSRYDDLTATTLIAKTTYSYSDEGRLLKIETRDGSATLIDSFEYAYDAAGQLTSRIDTQPGVNGGSPRTTTYDYDGQGQLTGDGSTSYSYDANGNRDGYTYDSVYANQIEDDGVWTYSYDGEGNVTDKISVSLDLHWHYAYDHANQLVEAKQYDYDASGPEMLLLEADYVYDVYGNRIQKIVDADGSGSGTPVATKFAVDGWNNTKSAPIGNENWDVWADLDGSGSLTTRYLRGDAVDQLFGRIGSGDPYWHLTDHLGSVRDVITTSGVASIDYDAFGNVLTDDAARGRYGWTGRELDVETGLQYNRARYYDSATGRWIGQDPLGFDAGDSNLYRYVNNQPTQEIDPSGLQAEDRGVRWDTAVKQPGGAFYLGRKAELYKVKLSQGDDEIFALRFSDDAYFCHGLAFGGSKIQPPISPVGASVDTILKNSGRWQKVELAERKDLVKGDIIVWRAVEKTGEIPKNGVVHSALIESTAFLDKKEERLDINKVRLRSKNGLGPDAIQTMSEVDAMYGKKNSYRTANYEFWRLK